MIMYSRVHYAEVDPGCRPARLGQTDDRLRYSQSARGSGLTGRNTAHW